MQCPSCGATRDNSEICFECGGEPGEGRHLSDQEKLSAEYAMAETIASEDSRLLKKSSTLIEFPGVNRGSVPEWRKELSERVREVQERRARDAAREAEAAELHRLETATSSPPPPQLELLPQATVPAMNPLVAAALKRIERAHQSTTTDAGQLRGNAVRAYAYAPAREENSYQEPVCAPAQIAFEPVVEVEPEPVKVEKVHNLVVVPAVEQVKPEPPPPPKRLIVDDPNDPALNYLDSISKSIRVEEIGHLSASMFRRLLSALLDLVVAIGLSSPLYFALKWTGTNLWEIRPLAFIVGTILLMTFLYLTVSIALTGRTWAMRLLSLRVIDTRTGLIPTGGQAAGRAIVYLISLVTVGLGILYALVSREGCTFHDRLTHTAVITN